MLRDKGLYDFIHDLGVRESNSNYEAKNNFGFMGRWQFGKPRLYDLGVSLDGWHPKDQPQKRNISWTEFKNDSLLQVLVMAKHVRDLKYRILKDPRGYKIGENVNGIEITLSGLIAGAHLKGIGGVKQFLEGQDNEDAYGTKISEYIKKFSGYSLVE